MDVTPWNKCDDKMFLKNLGGYVVECGTHFLDGEKVYLVFTFAVPPMCHLCHTLMFSIC